MVRVTTRRGTVELAARQDDAVPDGVVFIPFAYVEAAANLLTNPKLDPFGKIPEFKFCAAKVEAVDPMASAGSGGVGAALSPTHSHREATRRSGARHRTQRASGCSSGTCTMVSATLASPSIVIGVGGAICAVRQSLKLIRRPCRRAASARPGLVGAGVERAEPDLDAVERRAWCRAR